MPVTAMPKQNHSLIFGSIRRFRLMLLNAKEHYEQKGLFFLFKLLLAKAGFVHLSRTLKIVKLDLREFEAPKSESSVLCLANVDDINNDKEFDVEFFTKRKAIYRLHQGHRLFIVKEGHRIVFAIWVESNKNASFWWLDDLPLCLPKDMAYISGIFTSSDFRTKGIYSKVRDQLYSLLKEEGITTLIGTIHPDNTLSLKIHLLKKSGWEEYQTITYERFCHIRRYTVQKYDSPLHKTFVTLFKAPKNIWKTYL